MKSKFRRSLPEPGTARLHAGISRHKDVRTCSLD
jgi:hypothetical protein